MRKMTRYAAAIDPIRKRFGVTAAQAGGCINRLLAFEKENDYLRDRVNTLEGINKDLNEAIDKLVEQNKILQAQSSK